MSKILNFNQLKEILPFKYPFVLLDRAELDGDRVMAVKNVSMNESFFQGHFPDNPIKPGVLQVEAMTQTAILMMFDELGDNRLIPHLVEASRVKFRAPVFPGDQLVIECEKISMENGRMSVKARTTVNGKVTCQGNLVVACYEQPDKLIRPESLITEPPADLLPDGGNCNVGIKEIMNSIPHRYPFLLIDKVLHIDTENEVMVGLKNVTGNEPFFNGYLNKCSVLPSCLQMEIAAQVGCVYSLRLPENDDKIGVFMSIDKAIFHHPVIPGDQLYIALKMEMAKGRFGKAAAKLIVGERLVGEVVLKFAIVNKDL